MPQPYLLIDFPNLVRNIEHPHVLERQSRVLFLFEESRP
jgi:hypothetical protein